MPERPSTLEAHRHQMPTERSLRNNLGFSPSEPELQRRKYPVSYHTHQVKGSVNSQGKKNHLLSSASVHLHKCAVLHMMVAERAVAINVAELEALYIF